MSRLYPHIKPYWTDFVKVGRHQIYVEQCGSPEGIPVVFLHGGPGAGCEAYHRRFFNPEKYRVVLFDQRGAGRSKPHAELRDNTTDDLVADMELIRNKLDIDSWLVFGGSWGSTLALAYAQAHAERVKGMILRGVFLATGEEIGWFYQSGADRIFPDYWQDFVAQIPVAERNEMVDAYHRRLTGNDEIARMSAAKAWAVWEGRTASLLPDKSVVDFFAHPHVALSLARIECHYFTNNAFLEPNQLLDNADKLSGIPGIIIQGRYDMICPMTSAWELSRKWPDAELKIVADAGHAAAEPGISRALVDATDWFADTLS